MATNDSAVTLPTVQSEPWTMLAHKKPQKGWIAYNPRTMRPPPLGRGYKICEGSVLECQWVKSVTEVRRILCTATGPKGKF